MAMKIKGPVTLNLATEERIFWIRAFKKMKGETEIEERIIKRTVMRLLRQPTYRYPIYPDKECPLCERTYSHKLYDRHYFVCKRRHNEKSYDVDPEILMRLSR